MRVVGKELLVGMANGVAVGVIAGLVTTPLGMGWEFGMVVTLAMWGTLVVATTAGAVIPLVRWYNNAYGKPANRPMTAHQ